MTEFFYYHDIIKSCFSDMSIIDFDLSLSTFCLAVGLGRSQPRKMIVCDNYDVSESTEQHIVDSI